MMTIPQIEPLGMARTMTEHTAASNSTDAMGLPLNRIPNAAQNVTDAAGKTFADYLVGAVSSMNDDQLAVSALEQKVMTDPDSVDPQDVTIAMAKARMSLNLAQTVIDRLVTDWNEITTTR